MLKQNHGVACDYYAVGVLVHELMMGKRPFTGERNAIKEAIMAKQIRLAYSQAPKNWSTEAVDFVNHLLMRKPSERLGYDGPEQVRQHPWLADLDWDKLLRKEIESPFREMSNDCPIDQEHVNGTDDWDVKNRDLIEEHRRSLRLEATQQMFTGYEFDDQVLAQTVKLGRRPLDIRFIETNDKTLAQSTTFSRGGVEGVKHGKFTRDESFEQNSSRFEGKARKK